MYEVEVLPDRQVPTLIAAPDLGRRPRVGLALGGGGARGSVHVGVLRVLEREGIPVDMVAGTSSGALVGGAYAAGMPVDEIERIFSSVRWRDLMRWTWPSDGLFDNTPMARSVERFLGRVNIEDLRLPFAATATDTGSGEAVALCSGSLGEALRASTALPGLVRPVEHMGRRLVDGGVLHKVPVSAVRSLGADVIIAVDVSARPSGGARAGNPLAALMQVLNVMDRRLLDGELAQADFVVRPVIAGGLFSFRSYLSYVRAGESEAESVVEAIRERISPVQQINPVY